jgi:hypothetical protein
MDGRQFLIVGVKFFDGVTHGKGEAVLAVNKVDIEALSTARAGQRVMPAALFFYFNSQNQTSRDDQ